MWVDLLNQIDLYLSFWFRLVWRWFQWWFQENVLNWSDSFCYKTIFTVSLIRKMFILCFVLFFCTKNQARTGWRNAERGEDRKRNLFLNHSIYVGKICVEAFESVLAHAHCCLHMRIYIWMCESILHVRTYICICESILHIRIYPCTFVLYSPTRTAACIYEYEYVC